MTTPMTASTIIEYLGMRRHPEGGWYTETWRDSDPAGGRAHSTAIYYLLEAQDISRWHRVDAAEIWHWYAGSPLRLALSADGVSETVINLGPDLTTGQAPQGLVPRHVWQSARSRGPWTLVGCTVAPGFDFSGFELAPAGWAPGQPLG